MSEAERKQDLSELRGRPSPPLGWECVVRRPVRSGFGIPGHPPYALSYDDKNIAFKFTIINNWGLGSYGGSCEVHVQGYTCTQSQNDRGVAGWTIANQ